MIQGDACQVKANLNEFVNDITFTFILFFASFSWRTRVEGKICSMETRKLVMKEKKNSEEERMKGMYQIQG